MLLFWLAPHVWGYVMMGSLGFLLPSMRKELGLSPLQEGFLGAAPPVANILLAIPFGWLLSSFKPKLLSSFSFFAMAGLVFFQGWAPVYLLLLLGRFLYGVASISREPARVLLIRQWIPPREIVIANALANFLWGIVGLGFILIPVVLGLLDDNWRHTMYVFGIVSIAVALTWQIFGKERRTAEFEEQMQGQETTPLATMFQHRELWMVSFGMLGVGVNFSAFQTFWPSLMLDQHGLSLTASAVAMSVGGAFSAFVGLGVGLVASRVGKKRQILVLSGLILTGTTMSLLWISNYPLLMVLFLVQSVGFSFFPIAMTIPYELPGIRPREVAVASSILYTMLWIGTFIGPVLAGALTVEESPEALRFALLVTSCGAFLMTVSGFLLPRKWDRPPGI